MPPVKMSSSPGLAAAAHLCTTISIIRPWICSTQRLGYDCFGPFAEPIRRGQSETWRDSSIRFSHAPTLGYHYQRFDPEVQVGQKLLKAKLSRETSFI